MAEDRIVQLEIIAAEQERAIAELSEELARQSRAIDALTARIETMARRLVEVEDATAPTIAAHKPPHW